MQEYREDEVVKTEMLPKDVQEINKKMIDALKRMQDGEIDHVRIGRFPDINEAIEINGLRFVVVDHPSEGQFTASINDSRLTEPKPSPIAPKKLSHP